MKLTKQPSSNQKKVNRTEFKLIDHPFLYPIILLVLCFIGFIGFWFYQNKNITAPVNSKIVIINHDGKLVTFPTKISTVGGVLESLNISINKGDVVEPSLTTQINQENFRINVYRARPIEIFLGDSRTFSYSAATTPRAIASQVGVSVYPEDKLTILPTNNFLADSAIGERIVVDSAIPVNLNIYGTQTVVRTHAKTVAEFEKSENIKLAKGDTISPIGSTKIVPNIGVFLIHKGTTIVNTTQSIAMPQQTVQDASLAYGTSSIRQKGSPGSETITYQINLVNGVEVSRTVLQTIVTVQPVTQIVVQGTSLSGIKGDMALAGISPADYQYADYIISHESGWRPFASNASGAYGLCQALPGSKMSSAGSDWATNPITQLTWCSGYANSRYGGWYNAYVYWINNGNW